MSNIDINEIVGTSTAPLPFDLSEGQPLLAIPVDDTEAMATMVVSQLLSLVPDPLKAENPKELANDPTLAAYAVIRKEVQRVVQGAKAKNAIAYGRYLVEGLRGQRPWIVPPITLYHPLPLKTVKLANGQVILILPYGDFFVAIDGETQRIGWQYAAQDYPPALGTRVKVVIHHGKDEQAARQGFYDLNTREVKPNAAVAIAMDTMDVATRLTRRVEAESPVLRDGGVNLQRRQLRRSDPELVTISGLRTGVVTTILGASGLQVGSRPIDPTQPVLLDTDWERVGDVVVEVWNAIFEALEDEFQRDRRGHSVVSAPSILAGLGVLAHHAMPRPPRRQDVDEWDVEDVVSRLTGVNWERTRDVTVTRNDIEKVEKRSPWDGIAGKFTPSGSFSIGGPKEVGYAVAEALEDPESEGGRRIRSAR